MNEMIEQREKRLLRTVLIAMFISGAASQPLGSFIPYLRDSYGLSYQISGLLLSGQSIGNLVAVLVAGFLPVYLGRKRSILLTSIWMIVGYSMIAVGLRSGYILLLAYFMTGIARGGNSNFASTMVSTMKEPRATSGYHLLHGAYAIGALLSPLALILFEKLIPKNGWKWMAFVLAAMAIVQVLVYSRTKLPGEYKAKSVKAIDRSFFKDVRFWLGSVMIFCYISAEYAITGWLVTYFMDIGILTLNQAQVMNSLLWLMIFIGRMLGAIICVKISTVKLLLMDGIGFVCFFLIIFFSKTAMSVIIGVIGLGFFMSTIYPSAFSFGSKCTKGNDLGTSTMVISGSIGGILTPYIIGFIAGNAGIQAGMAVVIILTVLMLFSIVFSIRIATRIQKQSNKKEI